MEIWAHRGASRVAPENTMPAFERAIAAGADGIEFDVQLSRDGEVVVIHDETLSRTTDGTGRVVDHTLAELRALDASAGRDSWTDVRIPSAAPLLSPTLAILRASMARNLAVVNPFGAVLTQNKRLLALAWERRASLSAGARRVVQFR